MPPLGISREKVFAAAQEIADRGERPTQAGVRGITGTGSNKTLGVFLREWRDSQAQTQQTAPLPRVELPEPLANRALENAREQWAASLELADTRLQAEREQLHQARAAAEQELVDVGALSDLISDENEKLKEALEKAEQSNSEARKNLAAMEKNLLDAEKRRDTFAGQISVFDKRATELKDELAIAHETERKLRADDLAAAERHENQMAQLREETKESENKLRDQLAAEKELRDQKLADAAKQHKKDLTTAAQEQQAIAAQIRTETEQRAAALQGRLEEALAGKAQAEGTQQGLREQLASQAQMLQRTLERLGNPDTNSKQEDAEEEVAKTSKD